MRCARGHDVRVQPSASGDASSTRERGRHCPPSSGRASAFPLMGSSCCGPRMTSRSVFDGNFGRTCSTTCLHDPPGRALEDRRKRATEPHILDRPGGGQPERPRREMTRLLDRNRRLGWWRPPALRLAGPAQAGCDAAGAATGHEHFDSRMGFHSPPSEAWHPRTRPTSSMRDCSPPPIRTPLCSPSRDGR